MFAPPDRPPTGISTSCSLLEPDARTINRHSTRLTRLIAGSVLGRQLTVEFIGTFIVVLTVGLSTSSKGAGDLAPRDRVGADGDGLRRGRSRAHYNPAVSFAAQARRQAQTSELSS